MRFLTRTIIIIILVRVKEKLYLMWPHRLILCHAWVQCLSVLDHRHQHHLDLVNMMELRAAETSCCAAVSFVQSGQVDCLERGRGSGFTCGGVVPSKWSGRDLGIQLSLNENTSDEMVMHLCTYSGFSMFSYINFWSGTLRKLV